jgi:hypothetical protein
VLFVTSGFPPTILADVHRARMLCYDIGECGWDAEVLTPDESFHLASSVEARSRALRPEGIPVHEVAPWQAWLFRLLGSRSVGWRALLPLYRRGAALLAQRRFDLVFISTTSFPLFCLGRLWNRRFGVPFVLDFQDPWYHPATAYATSRHPVKARIVRWISCRLERWSLQRAAGVVSVSPDYMEVLEDRYPGLPCLRDERCAVIPFGATTKDFAMARTDDEVAGRRESGVTIAIAYVGAGGTIMARSFGRIAQLLRQARQARPELVDRVRIRLCGTDGGWREGDPHLMVRIAQDAGVGDLVEEHPQRIGYLDALGRALDADGLLVLGVDDPAYMPSKLFLYALTGKPLLACLHPQSQADRYFREIDGLGELVHFDRGDGSTDASDGTRVVQFLEDAGRRRVTDRSVAIEGFLSSGAARRHAALFEACVERK